jgi:uncharacterized protein YhjY with autotransporter beta-barrel domain
LHFFLRLLHYALNDVALAPVQENRPVNETPLHRRNKPTSPMRTKIPLSAFKPNEIKRRFPLLLFAATVATVLHLGIAESGAQFSGTVFFGEDLHNDDDTRIPATPNSDAAQARFFSSLAGSSVESFESFSDNQVPGTLSFTGSAGALTAILSGSGFFVNVIPTGTSGAGRYPTDGNNYLHADASNFTLTFPKAISGFSFKGVDIGDFGGVVTLGLTRSTGGLDTLIIPHTVGSGGSTDGSVLFFGFTSPSQPYTAIAFTFSGGNETFAFDEMTIVDLAQILAVAPSAEPILRSIETRTYQISDTGAINSLLTTGLLMPAVQRQAVQNAASGAIRDLNSRLFRARTMGREATPGDGPTHSRLLDGLIRPFESTTDTSTIRYLNFAANQNIDYRVALGLRDGVEVEYQDDSMALGDTFWATSPFALSGGPVILAAAPIFTTKAVIAAPAGASSGGKETFDDKVAIENPAYKRFETFAEFDYGFYDQDSLTNLVRGFDSDTYAGSAGLEYRLFPWLHVGAAFTYLQSDTELSSNLGGVDLDGTMLSGYFTAFWKQLYLDVLYSYGDFNNEVSRNTLLGRTAQGDTDSYAHNIDINLGHNYALSDQITAGPYAGFNYSTGGIDAYTETGGGTANVAYGADDYESMIGRLGWQVSYATDTPIGKVIVQGRANWAHQFMPEADTIQASLATSPFILVNGNSAHRVGGFAAESNSAHAGQDWLELGAGLRLDLDESWNVQLDYEGQFARNNASAHFAALKLEYEWDTVFLPGLGGKDVIATTADAPKAKGAGLKSLLAGKAAKSKAPEAAAAGN